MSISYFTISQQTSSALNNISTAINNEFGFLNGYPRINLGPCGSFAQIFFNIWNEFFLEPVTICFLFSNNKEACIHRFIKLPDGNYFDGGNGIVSLSNALERIPPDSIIEEMIIYDEKELDKNSYGLNRNYKNCPDYNCEKVQAIISSHLQNLLASLH